MNTDPRSLLNFFAAQNAEIDVVWFIVHFLLAALFSYLLSKVYVHFGNALSNREMFGRNFMILSMTTMLIITIVKSSVALSLGLVGALSIIRFRAAIKEPEELSYLFFAIAIGLGMGSQQALITGVAFLVVVAILALRHFTRPGETKPNLYLTLSGKNQKRTAFLRSPRCWPRRPEISDSGVLMKPRSFLKYPFKFSSKT